MKKALACVVVLLFAAALTGFAQESTDKSSDILSVLEDINQKLEKMAPKERAEHAGAPDAGFGGGPFMAFRILPDMPKMNAYIGSLGNYGAFNMVLFPFVDGGGGTWRWVVNKNFQLGMDFYGYGQSTLGYLNYPSPSGTTVDNTGPSGTPDGYDDYYSYASYGFNVWSFVAQGKIELAENLLYAVGGVKAGFGGEDVSISRNRRTVWENALNLNIDTGSTSWSRNLFVTGGYLGLQLRLDGKLNVFKLGLDAGFDYHVPLSAWAPSTGVHVREAAPPADFNSMNFWVSFGPQFHY